MFRLVNCSIIAIIALGSVNVFASSTKCRSMNSAASDKLRFNMEEMNARYYDGETWHPIKCQRLSGRMVVCPGRSFTAGIEIGDLGRRAHAVVMQKASEKKAASFVCPVQSQPQKVASK